jgi:hypothetical protein
MKWWSLELLKDHPNHSLYMLLMTWKLMSTEQLFLKIILSCATILAFTTIIVHTHVNQITQTTLNNASHLNQIVANILNHQK